jgi:hypothetical protein
VDAAEAGTLFRKADKLGDSYEGHYTRYSVQAEDAFVRFVEERGSIGEANARERYKEMLEFVKKVKLQMYVSSWHMNEEDSAYMWKLYTTMNDAICVTSTFQKLFDALPQEVHFGVVKYIDYEHDSIDMWNYLNYITHKRLSYAHEKEARAVINTGQFGSRYTEENSGVKVGIDLTNAIDAVYLSPSSPPLLLDIVLGLIRTYGLKVMVWQSEVNAPPPY